MEIGLGSIPLLWVDGWVESGGVKEIKFLFGNGGSGIKPERGYEVLMSARDEYELILSFGVSALMKCHEAGRGIRG